MSTYAVRCKHSACRHRRTSTVHPDEYKVVPACPKCGERKGWRLEAKAYNKRELCNCSGPDMVRGVHFPHRTHHPLCDNNPSGPRNQALARGVKPDELPLELMGEPCGADEAPFEDDMTRPHKINGVPAKVLDALADHRARCELTCERKQRYPDDHVARAVGTEQMAKGKAPQLFIYACKVCRGWHLTKQTAAPFWAADYYEKSK